MRFDARVALVTGAGRGMGRAQALALAERGASVLVADAGVDLHGRGWDRAPADDVVAEIRRAGGTALAYVGDLATEDGARGAVRTAMGEWGRIDVLVHSAGFTLGAMAFEEESLGRLGVLCAVNARAAYALAHEAWPHMLGQGYGRIVVASSTAIYGMATSVPYCTAKASYIGLVRALASAGRPHNVTVNAIEPSAATRMADNLADSAFKAWFMDTMKVELVAPAVLALAHESCTVTGELFVVGGGRVARTVLAETVGYVNPRLSPEDVRDHLAQIMGDRNLSFPVDTAESLRLAAGALGQTLGPEGSLVAADYAPTT